LFRKPPVSSLRAIRSPSRRLPLRPLHLASAGTANRPGNFGLSFHSRFRWKSGVAIAMAFQQVKPCSATDCADVVVTISLHNQDGEVRYNKVLFRRPEEETKRGGGSSLHGITLLEEDSNHALRPHCGRRG